MSGMVKLVTGELVSTASEEWRHECEARAILAFPLLEQRRAHLVSVGKRRGIDTQQKIQGTMLQIWSAQQSAKGKEGEHSTS